jgi:hypothetical protein
MMATCSVCNGTGQETFDEGGQLVSDACYHCSTTGEVDEETALHDRLKEVAYTLAYQEEKEYRKAMNEDPDGNGYDLHAYENMMHPEEYFRARVWDRVYDYSYKLFFLSMEAKLLLIAWNELPPEPKTLLDEFDKTPTHIQDAEIKIIESSSTDEIPF